MKVTAVFGRWAMGSQNHDKSTTLRARGGFVLIMVLIVVAMLSYSAYTFTYWLSVEGDTSILEARQVQARYLAESGIALVETLALQRARGQNVPQPGNLPDLFQGISVPLDWEEPGASSVEPSALGRFAVFHARPPSGNLPASPAQSPMPRFGVEPEAARIHLNEWSHRNPEALEQALLKLPGATTELVHAVLDWLDGDDDRRERGAEREDYEDVEPVIVPRNGPIESIEELLLVRGMTPQILFGEDANRNGRLDPNEDDGATSPPRDDEDGKLTTGWADYLTVRSEERNRDRRGRPRIPLNSPELGLLYSDLANEFGVELARFVIARRLLGPATAAPGEFEPAWLEPPGQFAIGSVLDLVDASVEGVWEGSPISLVSPITARDSAKIASLWDRVTTRWEDRFIGRLDFQTASEEAMRLVSVLSEETRKQILEGRPDVAADVDVAFNGEPDEDESGLSPTAWLLESGRLDLADLRAMEPFLAHSSPVVRFQSIGFADANRTTYRVEVVMDCASRPCRILEWRRLDRWECGIDLGELGRGADEKELPTLGASEESAPSALNPERTEPRSPF